MSQRWDVVSQFPDRVDSFGVGCLLFEVFEGSIERTQDLKRITNKMPKVRLHDVVIHNMAIYRVYSEHTINL